MIPDNGEQGAGSSWKPNSSYINDQMLLNNGPVFGQSTQSNNYKYIFRLYTDYGWVVQWTILVMHGGSSSNGAIDWLGCLVSFKWWLRERDNVAINLVLTIELCNHSQNFSSVKYWIN